MSDQAEPNGLPQEEQEAVPPSAKPESGELSTDISTDTSTDVSADTYNLSGDFRGAVINIKSTLVSSEAVKELESLPPEPGESPYLGLQYFDQKDADRFFGREELIAKIVNRLANASWLAVLGASGSGKSSLIRAGVLPALQRGERLADGSLPPTDAAQWEMRLMTPGAQPIEALAACLAHDSQSLSEIATLQNDLDTQPGTLSLAIRRLLARQSKKRLLLVIDQFEEVFTQCRQDEARQTFFEQLLHAADPASGQPVTVLLTLRADYYAQLAQHDRLREVVSQNQEFIGAMSRDELKRAILQPAALGNWKVQEGLAEVMLDDLGNEPGALPLLSHALLETWKRRRGRVMTVSGYTEAGGVQGAIAQTAEMVFRQRLTTTQQPIARMIFIKLAEMGEGALDTRRRATFSELLTRSTDEKTIAAVLSILTDARLVTTDTLEPGDVRVVEVAHEALIREWPTLRSWLDQNRDGLIIHRQITEDTNTWIKLERDPGALYRGARLQQALEWRKANAELVSLDEDAFLQASETIAKKEAGQARRLANARKIQIVLGGAAVLLVLAVLFTILAASGFFAPRRMSGVFNVAVSEIGETAVDGSSQTSSAGKQLSSWAANYLRDNLAVDPNIQVWPNTDNFITRTKVGHVTADEVEQMAEELNANLLLYGDIDTSQTPPVLVLRFWVAPQLGYAFEDIQGSHQFGEPIRVADLNDPAVSAQAALGRQASALAWVALGLRQVQLGEMNAALQAFQKSVEEAPQSDLVYFFLGREQLFLANSGKDEDTNLQAAEVSFQHALEINPQNPRASIGLGSVYFHQAAMLVQAAMDSGNPVSGDAERLVRQAIDAYQQAMATSADPDEYGVPMTAIIQMALGNAYQLQGTIAISNGDLPGAGAAFSKALEQLDQAIPVLQSSVKAHESHRRYLAQAYEYLGQVYKYQGYNMELSQDFTSAIDAYQQAASAYAQCVAQGQDTLDLIIKNEIVAGVCQPELEQVDAIVSNYSGGQ